MISKKYSCIFIHIPKTAGQSVEQLFIDDEGLTKDTKYQLLLGINPDPEKGPERISHLKACEYKQLGYVSEAEYENLFKFSFVRNPWERIVSEYRYRHFWKQFSFRDFVLSHLPEEDSYCDYSRHIIPQSDYLYDESGKLIVDYVGRFETLQDDFYKICQAIGFDNNVIPHINKSGLKKFRHKIKRQIGLTKSFQKDFKDYRAFFDDDTASIVENMYRKDIENFGYCFDGSAKK
ncbi:sulfotransferase family 2 domain-containing protein [Amphritea sp. 1_MG-2023]|uniref:sulfotransferase family 2 domain-containing protein n=1 Tax=Amphritea sp. 1_MG-2023 TaxID=3062670 RepID=UPI0026E46A23|nr:sulfotransferase family 2 domain-containing protein [Amphritea sp. 1_MG-2023]MDO6564785.1 sulfotransferase family 2 domain-containing protein [Amphritea sp. 1_MG-2023]